MKVYVTKYALTAGIEEMHGDLWQGYFCPVTRHGGLIDKKYFFEKREDAVKAAESMRDNKIKVLEDQIQKLKQKSF